MLDTTLRTTGLAENGISGLTYEEITGDPDPTPYTLWSSTCINL
jgi:hypothetical protein